MLCAIDAQNSHRLFTLKENARLLLSFIDNLAKSHKNLFLKAARIFMAAKIGIIILATISTMVFLLYTVTPYLTVELSKMHAMLFAFPLTIILLFKICFISKILMSYEISKNAIQSVIHKILSKGKRGVGRIGVMIPVELPSLSLDRVRDR